MKVIRPEAKVYPDAEAAIHGKVDTYREPAAPPQAEPAAPPHEQDDSLEPRVMENSGIKPVGLR